MNNILIENECLKVEISPRGAEMRSVLFNGEQRLRRDNDGAWQGKAPVLFPICGALKNSVYKFNGETYKLEKHGFARNSDFLLVSSEKNRAVFCLKQSHKTREFYPFDFSLFIEYILNKNSIKVVYRLINEGNQEMWASFGSHESYCLYDDINNYNLKFEKNEDLLSMCVVEGGLVTKECADLGKNTDTLPLSEELFLCDTVVLTKLNSRAVTLYNKEKKYAHLQFDSENLLIWKEPNAHFVCIEPWLNYPDLTDSNNDITKKEGIVFIKPKQTFINEHTVFYY